MNSKIIAEFLGWEIEKGMENLPDPYYRHSGGWGMVQVSDMQFHTSWDWLMPVVEKIYTMQEYRQSEPYYNVCKCYLPTPIELVYSLVVKFIEWYNQQPPHLTKAE